EARLVDVADVEVAAAGVGEGSRDQFGGTEGGANLGRLNLDLVERDERTRSSFQTLAEVRKLARGVPGVVVEVDKPADDPGAEDPVVIEISGDDFETLGRIAARIRAEIEDIPGLVGLDDDFDAQRPEIIVSVDRVEAARLGLTTADIARTLRTAVNGTEASTYRTADDDHDIVVRLAAPARDSLEALRRLTVVSEDGEQVPLEAVAQIERGAALVSIRHKDRTRVVTVSAKVTEARLAAPVREEAMRRANAIDDLLPRGYTLSLGGQSEDEAESTAFLSRAFVIAIVLVLGLMVGKFDSLAIPAIIITSVSMSMVGVLLGLLITDMPFGIVMTGVGIISLAGIVVNNAIVLLDYAEQLRERGLPRREVVMLTGARRFRPVMLTAITTILGLIPLTTGLEVDFRTLSVNVGSETSQYWRSMGVAVIFGLAFATFLTLILVPVLYDLLLAIRERFGGRGSASSSSDSDADEDEASARTDTAVAARVIEEDGALPASG
ncbi:MAG: efflux RND transporter permease subunit, partial [Acidobacteriota bacterium]